MTNSQRLAKVRHRLLRWISDFDTAVESDAGAEPSAANLSIVREAILIRDDYFCGRHFYTQDHHGIWFVEEDELKIYRNDGTLLCVLVGDEIDGDRAPKQGPEIFKLPTSEGHHARQESTRRAA